MPDPSATVPAGPMLEMPASVPPGMRLELSRGRLLPGAQDETDRWMQMLHDRYEECLDTLSAERMAFEGDLPAHGRRWDRVALSPEPLWRGHGPGEPEISPSKRR